MQNLWLHGPEHYITEVGTMNAFVAFKKPDGSASLTPILYDRYSRAVLLSHRARDAPS